jgi:hypothetical protein
MLESKEPSQEDVNTSQSLKKIFTKDITNKSLLTKIFKNFQNIFNKINHPITRWIKIFSR